MGREVSDEGVGAQETLPCTDTRSQSLPLLLTLFPLTSSIFNILSCFAWTTFDALMLENCHASSLIFGLLSHV